MHSAFSLPFAPECAAARPRSCDLRMIDVLRCDLSAGVHVRPRSQDEILRRGALASALDWRQFGAVVVVPRAGRFVVIDGARRIWAARLAGTDRVPALVIDPEPDLFALRKRIVKTPRRPLGAQEQLFSPLPPAAKALTPAARARGRIGAVPLDRLGVVEGARAVDPRAVQRLARSWDWSCFAPILVLCTRSGGLLVEDGVRRVAAAALVGVSSLPALIFDAPRKGGVVDNSAQASFTRRDRMRDLREDMRANVNADRERLAWPRDWFEGGGGDVVQGYRLRSLWVAVARLWLHDLAAMALGVDMSVPLRLEERRKRFIAAASSRDFAEVMDAAGVVPDPIVGAMRAALDRDDMPALEEIFALFRKGDAA